MLYGIGVAPAEEHGALGYVRTLEALARGLAPLALEQAPGVAAGDGGEPGAEAAVLGQDIEALDQDGEGDLRDVRGVIAGQPVSERDGIHQALVLVQQLVPRSVAALPATSDQISVGLDHTPFILREHGLRTAPHHWLSTINVIERQRGLPEPYVCRHSPPSAPW